MLVIIDRFESNFAVCETDEKTMLNIQISKLPKGAKEGDVLNLENGNIKIDQGKTRMLKAEIDSLMNDLWE